MFWENMSYKSKIWVTYLFQTMSLISLQKIGYQTALRISKESTRGNVVRICRKIYVDQCDLKI